MWVCLDSMIAIENEIVAGLTICLDIKNARKKHKQKEQEKKEQFFVLINFSWRIPYPRIATMSMLLHSHIILKIILKWPIAWLASHMDWQKMFWGNIWVWWKTRSAECRSAEWRSPGVLESRSAGVPECRSPGVPEPRNPGVPECRNTGVPIVKLWDCKI